MNEGRIENQQVVWRATSGWGAAGRIRLHVFIRYQPRGGLFADLADGLVLGRCFERRHYDPRRFAILIEKSPEGGLDLFSPR